MADEIKQTLPQKLCSEYTYVCVYVCSKVFVFYLRGMKTGCTLGGCGGGEKKKNSDTSSHIVHTFVTRPTFINYNWRFIYQSCQSQEPLDFFFHSLLQQSTLQSLCWLLYVYNNIRDVRSRIQQLLQWTLWKVIFLGDSPDAFILASRKTFKTHTPDFRGARCRQHFNDEFKC